jgi:hypothetical protein
LRNLGIEHDSVITHSLQARSFYHHKVVVCLASFVCCVVWLVCLFVARPPPPACLFVARAPAPPAQPSYYSSEPSEPSNLTLKEEFFAKKLNWVSISSLQKRNPIGLISVLRKIETQLGWCQLFTKKLNETQLGWCQLFTKKLNETQLSWCQFVCKERNQIG